MTYSLPLHIPYYRVAAILWMLLLLQSVSAQNGREERMQMFYDSIFAYQIEEPKTVLAIAIVETGWMECQKCHFRKNNLFGFRTNNGYMHFDNLSACLAYKKTWQEKNYTPWKAKHPNGTYYQFLTYKRYAANMSNYIKNIKWIEKWIDKNLVANFGSQPVMNDPENDTTE